MHDLIWPRKHPLSCPSIQTLSSLLASFLSTPWSPSAKYHNSSHPVLSPPSLPRSSLLWPIKSYHEANCQFDQLSVDLELEAFSRLSLREKTDEAGRMYSMGVLE